MARKGEPGLDKRPERLFGGGEGPTSADKAKKKYRRTKKGKAANTRNTNTYQQTPGGKAKLKEAQARHYKKKKAAGLL